MAERQQLGKKEISRKGKKKEQDERNQNERDMENEGQIFNAKNQISLNKTLLY